MIVLLIAGLGAIAAGLLAIWYGIPVKEFSFGNTMILAGVVGICAGLILLGLAVVVGELKSIARHLRSVGAAARADEFGAAPLPAGSITEVNSIAAERRAQRRSRFGDASAAPSLDGAVSSAPSREEAEVRHEAGIVDEAPDAVAVPEVNPPAERPRRNLLFQSSRRERAPDARSSPTSEAVKAPVSTAEIPRPHPSFDDAWPRRENTKPVPPAPQSSTDISVVKSGVVDGMAYSLYSDGSIEAQMPEGMMRFASIDDLRKHLDRRS